MDSRFTTAGCELPKKPCPAELKDIENGVETANGTTADLPHASPNLSPSISGTATGLAAMETTFSGLGKASRPTDKLTGRQLRYIVLQGFTSMVIAGAIDFAVGYGCYTVSNKPILLFRVLLADAAITTVVQTITSWLAALVTDNRRLVRGRVAPIGFFPLPARFLSWFSMLDHQGPLPAGLLIRNANNNNNNNNTNGRGGGVGAWAGLVLGQLGRALLLAAAAFVLLVGPTIGVLTAVGIPYRGDWVFLGRWDGALFKLMHGAALALLTSPVLAVMWMARAGWAIKMRGADAGAGEV